MKKLLYISNSLLPSKAANSVHVMKMCNALSNIGFKVKLLAKTKEKDADKDDIFNYFNVSKNFQIELWKVLGIFKISFFISFIIFPMVAVIERIKDKKLLIYSRNRHSSFLLSLLNISHSYELHGIPCSHLELFFDSYILNVKKKNKIIAISYALKEDIALKFGVTPSRVFVAHDAADIVDLQEISSHQLNGEGKINIGYVGSLLEGKGVDLLCRAAHFLPNYNFHVVGGSEKHIEKYIEEFNSDNLFFYGHVNQHEVLSFLKAFEIVVLPNKKDVFTANNENIGKYTSPLKLFEYMSQGKNIVASNIPVFREVEEGRMI